MSDNVDGLDRRLNQREAMLRHPLHTAPIANVRTNGNIPNTPLTASLISFLLGGVFSMGLLLFLMGGVISHWWATYQLGFFIAAWSGFHWGEFAVTAGWNLEKCSVDSFLLDNGSMYHIANGSAVIEYLITLYFKPGFKSHTWISFVGIIMVVFGQALRSIAMIHASTNFSHTVAYQKRETHRLVTDGVYAWFRHPSYAGFYYWAVGTQLVLQNPVCFVFFLCVLWRFFYYRTRAEENYLIRFFGEDYVRYRSRVRTWIPFVP
ncbi:ICMT-domain-containing protein [Dendrothele bispora CBS 962.96]|uniref:Protein-S-isoprenylcysteine O-methyltransferase n=1 Tax=Dendrothele bispora (strain CBS 962.96) TaxID=1314807 RepID=A0A4S8MYI4_DENBC|nr:ICMT-domain-containing protein [Dendrothele bispora CBS 962.96]